MMHQIIMSFLTAGVLGWLVVGTLLPVPTRWHPGEFANRSILALGVGIGVSALMYFIWLVLGPHRVPNYPWLETGLALAGGYLVSRTVARSPPNATPAPYAGPKRNVLKLGFALVALVAAATAFIRAIDYPHGFSDAWAIWNLRARFFFRAPNDWRRAFTPLLPWTHPDYPPLLAASVARGWTYAAEETIVVPMLYSLLFAAATVGLLVTALRRAGHPDGGWLAGALLASTPAFLTHSAAQMADLPLGFYLLASIILMTRLGEGYERGAAALLGVTTGLAAWTKNEGVLFALIICAVMWLIRLGRTDGRSRQFRTAAAVTGLAVPMLAAVLGLKMLAPPNDVVSIARLHHAFNQLVDPTRYAAVFRAAGTVIGHARVWLGSVALILTIAGIAGCRRHAANSPSNSWAWGWLVIGLMASSYFFVYVITPYEIAGHVDTSISRLSLHLWPSILYVYFLGMRPRVITPVVGKAG